MNSVSSLPAQPEAQEARRPYERPVLKRLGSVRELTLGGTGGNQEFFQRRG